MGKPEYKDRMADYVDVAERIAEFKKRYPDGTLQPIALSADGNPTYQIVEVAGKTFVVYGAAAYRTPDDPRPGIGVAWEPFPGTTPYTRDSELMNAETSAWGRAIVAVGIPTKKIASANEVRNRAVDYGPPPTPAPAAPAARAAKSRPAAAPNPVTAERDKAAEDHVTEPALQVPPDEEIQELLMLADSRGVTARQVRFWLKSRAPAAVAAYLKTLPDKAGAD